MIWYDVIWYDMMWCDVMVGLLCFVSSSWSSYVYEVTGGVADMYICLYYSEWHTSHRSSLSWRARMCVGVTARWSQYNYPGGRGICPTQHIWWHYTYHLTSYHGISCHIIESVYNILCTYTYLMLYAHMMPGHNTYHHITYHISYLVHPLDNSSYHTDNACVWQHMNTMWIILHHGQGTALEVAQKRANQRCVKILQERKVGFRYRSDLCVGTYFRSIRM